MIGNHDGESPRGRGSDADGLAIWSNLTRKQRNGEDNWKRTLETSRAKFKFIFIHHLVGGADAQNRGVAEAAPFYEWGGKNADGSAGFKTHRSGWLTPIHQLLARNKVSAL